MQRKATAIAVFLVLFLLQLGFAFSALLYKPDEVWAAYGIVFLLYYVISIFAPRLEMITRLLAIISSLLLSYSFFWAVMSAGRPSFDWWSLFTGVFIFCTSTTLMLIARRQLAKCARGSSNSEDGSR